MSSILSVWKWLLLWERNWKYRVGVMNECHCVTRCVCVFLLHIVLKHSLLKIGHRFHPGNFKEKSNFPPNANTSSENTCTFLIKEHTHSAFTLIRGVRFPWAHTAWGTAWAEPHMHCSPRGRPCTAMCSGTGHGGQRSQASLQALFWAGSGSWVQSRGYDVNCHWADLP